MYQQHNNSQPVYFDDSTLLDMEFDNFDLSSDLDTSLLDSGIDFEE